MPFPPCRVLTLAHLLNGSPVQYLLNAPSQPGGGLGLRSPDWLKDGHHSGGVHLADRQLADNRTTILRQGVLPLLAMLGVGPCWRVRKNIGSRALVEGFALEPFGHQ